MIPQVDPHDHPQWPPVAFSNVEISRGSQVEKNQESVLHFVTMSSEVAVVGPRLTLPDGVTVTSFSLSSSQSSPTLSTFSSSSSSITPGSGSVKPIVLGGPSRGRKLIFGPHASSPFSSDPQTTSRVPFDKHVVEVCHFPGCVTRSWAFFSGPAPSGDNSSPETRAWKLRWAIGATGLFCLEHQEHLSSSLLTQCRLRA